MVEFDWDEQNIEHLAQHDVTPAEFEFVVVHTQTVELDYDVTESGEERFRVIGMTHLGRMLIVVYTIRQGRIRAVTAFSASRKAISQWQRMQNE